MDHPNLESVLFQKLSKENESVILSKLNRTYCGEILARYGLKSSDFRAVRVDKYALATLFDILKESADKIYMLFPEPVYSGTMQVIGTGLYIGPDGNIDKERLEKISKMLDSNKQIIVAYTKNELIDELVGISDKEERKVAKSAEQYILRSTEGAKEARDKLKLLIEGAAPDDISMLESMGWLPEITLEDIGYNENIRDPINGITTIFAEGKHRAVLHAAKLARKRLEKIVQKSIFKGKVEIDEIQANHAVVYMLHTLLSLDKIRSAYMLEPDHFRERFGNNPLFNTLGAIGFDEYLKIGTAGILHDAGKWLDIAAFRGDNLLKDRFHPNLGSNIFRRLNLPYPILVEGHHANLSGINQHPNMFNGHGIEMNYVPNEVKESAYPELLYFPRMIFYAYELMLTALERQHMKTAKDPQGFEKYITGLGFGSIDDYLTFKTVNYLREITLYPRSGKTEIEEPVSVELMESTGVYPADSEVMLRQKGRHESKDYQHKFDGSRGRIAKDGVVHVRQDKDNNRVYGTVDIRTGVESEIFDIELITL